eukprot:COSAG01_NODE_16651_length_1217_cov_2.167263_1_plen_233_part_00
MGVCASFLRALGVSQILVLGHEMRAAVKRLVAIVAKFPVLYGFSNRALDLTALPVCPCIFGRRINARECKAIGKQMTEGLLRRWMMDVQSQSTHAWSELCSAFATESTALMGNDATLHVVVDLETFCFTSFDSLAERWARITDTAMNAHAPPLPMIPFQAVATRTGQMQLITTEATPSFGEVTTQQLVLSGPELAACNIHGGAIASILKYVQMVLGKSDRFHEVEWQLHLEH